MTDEVSSVCVGCVRMTYDYVYGCRLLLRSGALGWRVTIASGGSPESTLGLEQRLVSWLEVPYQLALLLGDH